MMSIALAWVTEMVGPALYLILLTLLRQSLGVAPCRDGDLRLVGGDSLLKGRVEICSIGKWGKVCGDMWDTPDARVVCRQLGFSDEDSVALAGRHIKRESGRHIKREPGRGVGDIVLSEVACVGNESTLIDCMHAPNNCSNTEEAGVKCRYKGQPTLLFHGQRYQNNSVILLQDIGTGGDPQSNFTDSLHCLTDRYPCCGSQDGMWFNAAGVPADSASFYQTTTSFQSVILHRLSASYYVTNGIFRCAVMDSLNVTRNIYIGRPSIYGFRYKRSSKTLICFSSGEPVTSVSWTKYGEPLAMDGITYQHSQIITDTASATYENRLVINEDVAEINGLYTCSIGNIMGNASAQLLISACSNGDAILQPGTDEVSELCYNGTTNTSPTHASTGMNNCEGNGGNQNMQSSDDTVYVLGVLLGIFMAMLAATVVIVLVYWIIARAKMDRAKMKHCNTPFTGTNIPHPASEEAEHYASNAIYGVHSNSISFKLTDGEVQKAKRDGVNQPGASVDDRSLEESVYLNVSQVRHMTGTNYQGCVPEGNAPEETEHYISNEIYSSYGQVQNAKRGKEQDKEETGRSEENVYDVIFNELSVPPNLSHNGAPLRRTGSPCSVSEEAEHYLSNDIYGVVHSSRSLQSARF